MESTRSTKGGKSYKLSLSLMAVVISAVAFAGLMLTEDLRALTGTSLFKFKACSSKKGTTTPRNNSSSRVPVHLTEKEVDAAIEDDAEDDGTDSPLSSRRKCSVVDGKWVYNESAVAPYTVSSCPYLDKQVSCARNGRPDEDYLRWEWQTDDCDMPRFDAATVLEKLRGKRLMFVGDSLQRGQWQSFVCLIESHLAPEQKSFKRGRSLSIFSALEYNATVEFYWAPFLVESNSDVPIITDANQRILRVDSIQKHAQNWVGVDILVFNTYVWWMSGLRIKSVWGTFANGLDGYEELDAVTAYRLGMKTWANWVDSNIDPNKTRVFFTTMSPTHMRSADWHHKGGIRCYNETQPVTKRGYWGSGSDKRMMEVVSGVVGRMRVPVSFLNITQLSEYRIDGHVSVHTETGGMMLTDEQKANPRRYADCIHWCLPGVPDTWNRVLNMYL